MKNTMRLIVLYCLVGSLSCMGFAINQTMVDQGLIIAEAGEWVVQEPLRFREGMSIQIVADDVTLDLNGYRIHGGRAAEHAIIIRGKNGKIKNGECAYFTGSALVLDHADGALIENIACLVVQQGVAVIESVGVTMQQIKVVKAEGIGIEIVDSPFLQLGAFEVKDVHGIGIAIRGDSAQSLIKTFYLQECLNSGLLLETSNVQVQHGSVQRCGADGMVITGNNVTCTSITSIAHNGSGIVIGGTDIALYDCKSGNNAVDGLRLESTAERVVITAGQYAFNGAIGVNNMGLTTNKASYMQVHDNKQRDTNRIFNTVA